MTRFFIGAAGLVLGCAHILAHAGALPADASLPQVKKGIWAITHDQALDGIPHQHIPERILDACLDPLEKLQQDVQGMEKHGCHIEMRTAPGELHIDASHCPVRPGAATQLHTVLESRAPDSFKITTDTNLGRVVLAGRWIRACPARE